MRARTDPLVIGASGGSGTRVFARIARHAGIFMGLSLNTSEDSKPFSEFYDAWTPLYLLKREGRLSDFEQRAIDEGFTQALQRHLANLPHADAPWGMKNPRSLAFLPFWHQRYPRMKFLHVVRQGLDMVYSGNQREFQMYGHLALTREERTPSRRARAITYWCKQNLSAAAYGERHLPERYLRVRFEDLCADPVRTVRQIFDFLEVADRSRLEAAVAEVASPRTIGRWRAHAPAELHELMTSGRAGLTRFGYWDAIDWQAIDGVMHAPRWSRWLFQQIRSYG